LAKATTLKASKACFLVFGRAKRREARRIRPRWTTKLTRRPAADLDLEKIGRGQRVVIKRLSPIGRPKIARLSWLLSGFPELFSRCYNAVTVRLDRFFGIVANGIQDNCRSYLVSI
jgi:hypothetical protein